ncbi:MAG: thiol reductant ABC exporter subunit CydD [Candidatus Nanopelagicales bacterium]
MRPLDPRLLRYARSTRGFLLLAVVLGAATAVLVILQARLLSGVIVDVTAGGAGLDTVASGVGALAAVVAARAAIAWGAEAAAFRTSARAKQELREAALEHVVALGPAGPAGSSGGEVATLVTRGVDALDGYFARYLPQLVLAVIVPVAVLLTILGQDILSAVIVAVTLPLIPVFMILIGLYTRSRVDRQWRTLAVLSGHFLDLVAGLPTLKVLGRAQAQVRALRAIGDRYRRTTMGVLRVSFLSSLALELLATLSVALVAVSVGLRLAEGQIAYAPALFILLLAPEAYLPLRLVGQHFHAAAEGLGAAQRLFELLETPAPLAGGTVVPPDRPSVLVESVSVTYPGRDAPALHPTTVEAAPGQVVAVVGPSGGGKSTLLAVLLGFVPPTTGVVALRGADGTLVDQAQADPAAWRARFAWVPQSPQLVAPGSGEQPTVAAAVRLGRPDADDDAVRAALAAAGVLADMTALPDGLDTRLDEAGGGLSAGQRRRVAVARALLTDAPVLLLDEPTAALDGASEQAVVEAIRAAAAAGRTVIVVAHRPAVVALADLVLHVAPPAGAALPDPADPAQDAFASAERDAAASARGTVTRSGW